MWKVSGIARDKKHGMHLRRSPDHRMGQFDAVAATESDCTLRNPLIDCQYIESIQESSRCHFDIAAGANHNLHPGDDADGLVRIVLQFGAGFRNSIEIIDENIGIEERLHHSRRTFS